MTKADSQYHAMLAIIYVKVKWACARKKTCVVFLCQLHPGIVSISYCEPGLTVYIDIPCITVHPCVHVQTNDTA